MAKLINLTKTIALGYLAWGVICLVTMKRHASTDGADIVGWPLIFYKYYSHKMHKWVDPPGFMPLPFIGDLLLVLLASTCIFFIVRFFFLQ